MDAAPVPGGDITRWQPPSSTFPIDLRGRAPTPPFNASGVRRSALDHVRIYRRLFNNSRSTRIESHVAEESSEAIDIVPSHPSGDYQQDLTAKRTVIQGMLLADLQGLLTAINRLERLLRRWRSLRWLVNGTLAAVWNAIVVNYIPTSKRGNHRDPILNGNYLATASYILSLPLFGFPSLNYERKLSCTVAVKEGLMDLHGLVRKGAALDDTDLLCLTDSQWDVVPWSKIEEEV